MSLSQSNLITRFWTKVDKNGDCWVWTGCTDKDGYGEARIKGLGARAHRIAYALTHGPIPTGLCVCHTCDNPRCVRPDHLWLGTVSDNNRDRQQKGRTTGAKGRANGMNTRPDKHWSQLYPEMASQFRGENSVRAKLTSAQAEEIRTRKAIGISVVQLTREYGVCETTIYNILKGRTMYGHE